jgi:uncharacterized protein
MSRFAIGLGSLRQGLTRLEVEVVAQDLDLPEAGWTGPIRGAFDVEKTGENVSVRGFVAAMARLECVRCLTAFDRPVQAPLEVFAERAGGGRPGEEQALERDECMKFHDGRQLDLRNEARETLLLELPMVPHCREDCRGLCPRCGADLNAGPCGCPRG